MKKLAKQLLLASLITMTISTSFAKKHQMKDFGNNSYKGVISFENKKELQYWQANKQDLKVSDKHYKQGAQSLKWIFEGGDILEVNHPDVLKSTTSKNGGMKAWIYNETPIDGQLSILVSNKGLLEHGKAVYEFQFKLNYTGWRAFWVHYQEDIKVDHTLFDGDETLDMVQIIAPSTAGEIYWDNVEFTDFVDGKRSDDQFKVIDNEIDHFGVNHPWEYSNFWSDQPVASTADYQWNSDIKKDFSLIEKRYMDWVLGDNPDYTYEPLKIRKNELEQLIEEAKVEFASLNIKRHKNGTLTGEPLYTIREGHWPYYANLSMKVLLQLALDYKINGNKQSLEKYFLALDYMRDQGWAEGSAMGTIDHELLRHAGYFHSIYLLKDELKSSGRLADEIKTAKWFLNWNELYNMPDYVGCTADFMRSVFIYRMLIVLAQEDGPEKLRDMTFYNQWINNSMRVASGFADTFKPDFTGYHHRGVYMNAYSPGAYHLAAVVSYLLHGTEFKVLDDRIHNLRQAVMTARIMNCKYNIPLGVCARFPENTSNFADVLPAMAYLLKLNPEDKELQGIYKNWWRPESPLFKDKLFPKADSRLSFYHTLGALQIMKDVGERSSEEAKSPQGNWFKPYAGLSIHRRDNWMVSVKGWSAYIWDFESGRGENVFGRYEGYGALQFFTAGQPVSDRSSGYQPDKGWDWSRIPGTTSIHLPLRKMEHGKKGFGIFKKNTHRNFTDQTFLAGVSSKNGNGIFANKIHDTAFDLSFWARKSVFFFDNLVVCLGDGIRNNDVEHDTETTLFQIYAEGRSLKANGKEVRKGKYQTSDQLVLNAPDRNSYIIPAGQAITYQYQNQKSIQESGKGETEGIYYTAVLDHAKAPKNAAYEYAVVVNGAHRSVSAQAYNYEVLQKDASAHVVKYKNEYAYVIWDMEYESQSGHITSLSVPGVAMVTETKKGIELAFSDPDLRRPKLLNTSGMAHENVIAASHPQLVRIILNGKYKIKASNSMKVVGYTNDTTIVEVMCKDGESYHATMLKQ